MVEEADWEGPPEQAEGEGSSKPSPDEGSELFVALVAAVGTDVKLMADALKTQLRDKYGYEPQILRLSDYLADQVEHSFRDKPFDEELWEAMTAGDKLRESWKRNDALAFHAVSDIVLARDPNYSDETAEVPTEKAPSLGRHAFILRSLKTPAELELLRRIYGSRLIVIAGYSPTELRLEHLAEKIKDAHGTANRDEWTHQPEALVDRDEKGESSEGQNVSGTFHRADFFIRGWDRDVVETDVDRTLEILFGSPFRTPTRDEHGQFIAAGAALRSAEFGRQVGAAIRNKEGSIVAVGTNEVPKHGGGSHWEEDGKGNRNFEIEDIDTNRRLFDELAATLAKQIEARMKSAGSGGAEESEEFRTEVLSELPDILRKGGLKDLTEFGRAVHAEMNAILDAARRGFSIQGATIHSTTFPCHNCARHIVGAGIERVVFIEPYRKSRAEDLHSESIEVEKVAGQEASDRTAFDPFVGVAPRRYLEMFDADRRSELGGAARKDGNGRRETWDPRLARPVCADTEEPMLPPDQSYRERELLALDYYWRKIESPSDSVRAEAQSKSTENENEPVIDENEREGSGDG